MSLDQNIIEAWVWELENHSNPEHFIIHIATWLNKTAEQPGNHQKHPSLWGQFLHRQAVFTFHKYKIMLFWNVATKPEYRDFE